MKNGGHVRLYLVKTVVNLHHGDVSVKSREGEGSRFLVRLPAGQQPPPAQSFAAK
jgi:two-component system OmpR family sensor kinase